MKISEVFPGQTVMYTPELERLQWAKGKRTVKRIEQMSRVVLDCGDIRLVAKPSELSAIPGV